MTVQWIGSILVITTCSLWGIRLAAAYQNQKRLLGQLLVCVQHMRWELCYRLTPLPELCKDTAQYTSGSLKRVFLLLSFRIESNSAPDVSACMKSVLSEYDFLPPKVRRILRHLGKNLGRYDLEGQLQGMDAIIQECEQMQNSLSKDLEIRVRSYRTLGLCAGVALVILFI